LGWRKVQTKKRLKEKRERASPDGKKSPRCPFRGNTKIEAMRRDLKSRRKKA